MGDAATRYSHRQRTMAAQLLLRCLAALLLLTMTYGAPQPRRMVVLGGTGRIGSACAAHLLRHAGEDVHLVLAGRSQARGVAALAEVRKAAGASASSLSFSQVDWTDGEQLRRVLEDADAVVHTAGPFGERADVLRAAIRAATPVYVDLSDPIEYIEDARGLTQEAANAGTVALLCAGAFPGLSNVLAMECAARLGQRVRDLRFSYFTAGLGGSGDVNLCITNVGFGTPVPVYRAGKYKPQMEAGSNSRRVSFFLDGTEPSASLVGDREVWSWPFPEGCTVAREMDISGDSSVGMGTAPAIWNTVMGAMVAVVPRELWLSEGFSNGLARFSKPLVAITDRFVGETHAMRVDVVGSDGSQVSVVQAHRSFREIVGQSAAEFTLSLLKRTRDQGASDVPAGVWTPEAMFREQQARTDFLKRVLAVEGTLNWGFDACRKEENGAV